MAKVTGSGNTSQNMFQRAQELLQSYSGRLRDVMYGADYPDPPETSRNKDKQAKVNYRKTPEGIRSSKEVGGRYTPKGSSKYPIRFPSLSTPKIPGSSVQPLVTGLKPKPNYPGPAGNLGGLKGGGVKGSLVLGVGEVAGQLVIPHISREAVRGAQVVLGKDTTNYDNLNSGRPVVKTVNGVSYNIATPEGLSGYQKAMKEGGKDTTPDKRTGSVDTPTEYPTEAVLETIKPSRDYEKEANESSGSDDSGEERTSPEGVAQYGQTLGGLNTFNKGFLGEGYDLTDIKMTYQSVALPATLAGVTQLEKPLVEGASPTQKPDVSSPFQDNPQTQASFPEGTKPFASTDSYTPYSTGGNPENAQDGASPKADRVERIRQVAFNGADFSGAEPDDSTLVAPMYRNKKRNAIRDAFLNPSMSSVKASVAANALAGHGKDSNGRARFNVGGELVYAKEGMQQQAKNAANMGVDPTEFLDIPSVTPKKDAPSTLDLSKVDVTSSAFTTAEPDAQDFFKKELNKIKTAK